MRFKALLLGLTVVTAAAGFEFSGLFSGGLDHPAIEYATRPAHNVISDLNREIQAGKRQLTFDGPSGYLRSTMQALKIPVQSQMVVFSKTSLQQLIINPSNPRTIVFNDSVAAAWVPGEPFVELAVHDPQQGVIFYTLNQIRVDKPVFVRRDQCLTCHESHNTLGVPGMLVRSVFTASNGATMRQLGDFISDHRSPFKERWGGWFVTGKVGGVAHMGNLTFDNVGSEGSESITKSSEIDSLEGKFDLGAYLSPYSDIVALMVFEHQMHMVNLLTRAGWEIRSRLYDEHSKAGATQAIHTEFAAVLEQAAHELADYILFVDETPLPGRIQGTSGFAEEFATRGPRDKKGRCLRQFDLERRLMRYPCSYMIYSDAFEGLPSELKDSIYQRMWRILSGQDKNSKYARLSPADRQAILEILRETKPALPSYFKGLQN
jgi:hypothetical protein